MTTLNLFSKFKRLGLDRKPILIGAFVAIILAGFWLFAPSASAAFTCGDDVTFGYRGQIVTYGTVESSGECWMNKNLGATSIATNATDSAAYGDLIQWGRLDDGHQATSSGTTSALSTTDYPGHSNFIEVPPYPYDWRSGHNDNLWQASSSYANDPCPDGWGVPTFDEWNTELASWGEQNWNGAFNSPLKLTAAGRRNSSNGLLVDVGTDGYYWSSTVNGIFAWTLIFGSGDAYTTTYTRASGCSVRCVYKKAVAAVTVTLATSTAQTINAHNNLTIGDGTYEVTVTGDTYNPALDIDGNLTISASSTLVASTSVWYVARNWTNLGIFTAASGTVNFDDSSTSTISGATTFYNLTATTSNKTLQFATGTAATTTVDGTLTLNGQDCETQIKLCSTDPGTGETGDSDHWWYLNAMATASVNYVDVQDSNATGSTSTIVAHYSEDSSRNVNWSFEDPCAAAITISGNIYLADETTPNATSFTIALSVNNTSTTTTTATSSYTFSDVSAASGNSIAVYIESTTTDANTFTVTDGSTAISNLHLYLGKVAIGNNNSSTTLNSDICNQSDYPTTTDRLLSCSGNNITVNSGVEFHILQGKAYDTGTGATLTTQGTGGDFHIDDNALATLSATTTISGNVAIDTGATSTIYAITTLINVSAGGNWTNNGNFVANTSTVTFTATSSGKTITTGGSAFYNLTFNGSGGGWTISGTNATATNNFTITNGTATSTSAVLSVGGNWLVESGGTFNHNNAKVLFNATSSGKTITTGGSPFYDLEFNGSGGIWDFQDAATTTNDLTITAGTLDLNGQNLVVQGGDINVTSTLTADVDSGTVTLSGTGNLGGSGTTTVYNINLSGTTTLAGDIDANNDLSISSGQSLDVSGSSYEITVGGSWSNSGTFTAQNGTVTFDGSTTSTFSGATTFYNLISTTTSKTLEFSTGTDASTTIEGTFTLDGQACGTQIKLCSTASSSYWYLNAMATTSIDYVDVQDSNATGSASTISATNSTDSGNNVKWSIDEGVCGVFAVSGNAYEDETSAPLSACNGTTTMISLRVGGNTYGPVSCATSTGAFTFSGVTQPATSTVMVIWIDNQSGIYGSNVNRYAGSGSVTIAVRRNRVIVQHDDSGPITVTDMDTWEHNNDADINYKYQGNVLTVESGSKLIVNTDDTFTPGKAVTLEGTGANPSGDLLVMNGAILNGTYGVTVNGGDVEGDGTINLTDGSFLLDGTGYFGGNGANWIFYTLKFGNDTGAATTTATGTNSITILDRLDIILDHNLNAGSKTYNLQGPLGTLAVDGTLTPQSSTFIYESTSSPSIIPVTFNDLQFNPDSGTPTYTISQKAPIVFNGTFVEINGIGVDTDNEVIYFGAGGGGNIYRCNASTTSCDEPSDWTLSYLQDGGNHYHNDFAYDSVNKVMYTIQFTDGAPCATWFRCDTSTGCTTSSDWLAYGGCDFGRSITFDSINSVLYAGIGISLYRCNASTTNCTSTADWTSYSGFASVYSLTFDSINSIIYAGNNSGKIYRCNSSTTNCTSFADWTTSTETGQSVVYDLAFDSTNGVIYAGTGENGIIYRCDTSTGCTTSSNWTVSIDFPIETKSTLTFDSLNGFIYAATIPHGAIYRCDTSTNCDEASDWYIYYDTTEDYFWEHPINSFNGIVYVGGGSYSNIYRIDGSASPPTLTTNNDLTWTGAGAATLDASIFNPNINVDGNISINSSGTLIAPNSGSYFNVAGNWTNSGTFTHSTGTVTFDDNTVTSTFSGATTFYNLTSTTTSKGLEFATGTVATTTVAGTLTLDGQACETQIKLRSTQSGEYWYLNALATTSVDYVDVQDSNATGSASTISATNSTDSVHNVKWSIDEGVCAVGITVSGNAYEDEGTTVWTGCTSTTANISLVVNGTSTATTTCSTSTGYYEFTSVIVSANDPVSVFFNTTDKGVAVTVAIDDSSDIALNPRKNRVWLTQETGISNITNANLNHCDSDGPAECSNIPYAVTSTDLNIELTAKLIIESNKSFVPGGSVTLTAGAASSTVGGDVLISSGATFGAETNSVSVGGDWSNQGDFSKSAGQTTTFTATSTGFSINPGSSNFENLTFNGSGGGWLYQDSTSTAPATTTVHDGEATFLNAKTGGVLIDGGTLNVDWYLGIHVVDKDATSTDINTTGTDPIVISEASSSAAIWRHNGTDWIGPVSSTSTDSGDSGKNPQPNSDGAIRIREYSNSGGTPTYYKYNVTTTAQSGYGAYDYSADHRSGKFIISTLYTGEDQDDCISQTWHRTTISALNEPYPTVNNPPDKGSWFVGMASTLEFSVSATSTDLGSLYGGNDWTAIGTTTLSVTTTAYNGYVVKAYADNQGKLRLGATENYIDRWTRAGATNATPTSWDVNCSASSSYCAFGYTTSDDTLTDGTLDRFTDYSFCSATTTNKCWAGFATSSASTDPVADATSTVSGATTTITYKVSVDGDYVAGDYSTKIYYICTANY